jgi:hypothetical protein
MSVDFSIPKDEMCERCRDEVGTIERGIYPLLNMEEEADTIKALAAEYERRGLTGPLCRRCARLPVVS